ncbi:MAG: FkbM family methyltransferase [Pseudomonadota bacterium]
MRLLRLRHLVATSSLGAPVDAIRQRLRLLGTLRHPELGPLLAENLMMDRALDRLVTPGTRCVDVGAHLGSMTMAFRRRAAGLRHIAVEASPTKAAWLAERLSDVDVRPVAVSDTTGHVSFYENLAQPGFSSLADRSGRGATAEITVEAVRLDDLLDGIEIGFMKIDVEGFELQAIRGAEATIRRCRPTLLFEAGAATDGDVDQSAYDALFDLLTGPLGYEVRAVVDFVHDRPAIDAALFRRYRTYPFTAFNFVATPV